MFDIVEMNGCILNFAVKKPAIEVKHVVRTMHIKSARTTLPPTGIPVKSKIWLKTPPVLIPLMHDDRSGNHAHTYHTSDGKICSG